MPEPDKLTVEKLQAVRGFIEGVTLSKAQLRLLVEQEDHTRWVMTITAQAVVTIGPDGQQTTPQVVVNWVPATPIASGS
jgi:hypothetical protein